MACRAATLFGPLLLALALVGGAAAQGVIYYRWNYINQDVFDKDYGSTLGCDQVGAAVVSGVVLHIYRATGLWSSCVGGVVTCQSPMGCQFGDFYYGRNGLALPVSMSPITGLPVQTAVIMEYDAGPVLIFERSGRSFISMLNGMMAAGVIKGVAGFMVGSILAFMLLRTLKQILDEHLWAGGRAPVSAMAHEDQVSLTEGYDGQD